MISKADRALIWGRRSFGLIKNQPSIGPAVVQIGISNACNYKCVMCWDHPSFVKEGEYTDETTKNFFEEHPGHHKNRELMDEDLFRSLIDDLKGLGTERIRFIGRGEPFTNKKIMNMVEHATGNGFFTEITSNGSLIDKDKADQLIAANLFRLHLSVNAASSEIYSKIATTESSDRFKQVIEVIKYISEEKKRLNKEWPILHLSFVISSYNAHEVNRMVDLAIDSKADSISMTLVNIYEGSKFLNIDKADRSNLATDLEKAKARASSAGIENDISNLISDLLQTDPSLQKTKFIYQNIPCYVGHFFSIILADGMVHPCCESHKYLGDIKKDSFKEIWASNAYRDFRVEARALPTRGSPVKGCRCFNCSSFLHRNMQLFKFMHPLKNRIIDI